MNLKQTKLILTRVNSRFLPGVIFPKEMRISTDLESVIKDSKIVVLAVPSQAVRSVCKKIKPFIKRKSNYS